MLAALLLALAPATHDPRPATRISPTALESHIRFLASDLLEGRETATRGYDLAAEYVATQFAAMGLKTEMQPIEFRSAIVDHEASSLSVNGTPLVAKSDFILRPSFIAENVDVDAPVVSAGFGLAADYAHIDARGKVVIVFTGAPEALPSDQRAYYSGTLTKALTAAAHGAVGMLFVATPTDEKRFPFAKQVTQIGVPAMRYVDNGRPADAVASIRFVGLLSPAGAAKVKDGMQLRAHVVTRLSSAKSENVIGILRGSTRPNETVVVSAHLDHLGLHDNPSGDPIYNGAYDNASGVAMLIEIARAFASLKQRPRRTVIFLAVCGEEKGEQGSLWFARHPLPAGTRVVTDVNMDMFLMLQPVKSVVIFGGEHSSLGAVARRAATANGFSILPDPAPEEVRFIRSDQYSFVRTGVPAVTLKSGETNTEWLRTIYHSPKDDLNQPFDFPSGARYAKTNFDIAYAVANAPQRPRWNEGDFFAKLFATKK
jgi:hypothetical protein